MTDTAQVSRERERPEDRHGLVDEELADQLLARAEAQGVELLRPDGLLSQVTKAVLERALGEEMAEHLGCEKHDPAGRGSGNSRNGTTPKRLLTEIGPVELQVPRDRAGSFDPRIVRKGQRRLEGFNDRIIALDARGMTTRDIRAHLREIYDVDVSADLISRVTDAVVEDLAEWQSRPLDSAWSPSVVANASEGRRSHVAVCAEQDAGRGEAPVPRVDQDGHEGCCGRAGGGRVDQLRVGVVPRRWRRVATRSAGFAAVLLPGRSDRDRRRPARRPRSDGDRCRARQEPPERLPGDPA